MSLQEADTRLQRHQYTKTQTSNEIETTRRSKVWLKALRDEIADPKGGPRSLQWVRMPAKSPSPLLARASRASTDPQSKLRVPNTDVGRNLSRERRRSLSRLGLILLVEPQSYSLANHTTMSAIAKNAAGAAGKAMKQASSKAQMPTSGQKEGQSVLNKGARRDPELYVRLSSPISSPSTKLPLPDLVGHHVRSLRSRRILLRTQAHISLIGSRRLSCKQLDALAGRTRPRRRHQAL